MAEKSSDLNKAAAKRIGGESDIRVLLKKIQSDLRSIPKMPKVPSDPTLAEAVLTTPAAAIQGIRRGIRVLRGGEPEKRLKAKEAKLQGYLDKIGEMKKTAYRVGDDKYVDYFGKPVDPSKKEIMTTKSIPKSLIVKSK